MKERGVIFSAPMVRALLAGEKTQTRRPLKLPPAVVKRGIHPRMDEWMPNRYTKGSGQYAGGNPDFTGDQPPGLLVTCLDGTCQRVPCPYGVPGDRLWVRETFAFIWPGEGPPAAVRDHHVEYRADCPNKFPGQWPDDLADDAERPRWKPSIFLPRWASRITLDVTEVRVQRLQDISEEDAKAEGVAGEPSECAIVSRESLARGEEVCGDCDPCFGSTRIHRPAYERIWNEINGAGSWQTNPFVWAISFKRVAQ